MNIYYDPEKFGLATVGEVEWSDGCYQFDLTVVWRDVATGALFFADDSGCSCPSPYQDTGRDDLKPITRTQVLIDHLAARAKDREFYESDESMQRISGDIGALVVKVREAAS